ncbi:hypothetical protein [Bacillus sp. AFS029533]|uniref:hypothetical protein n=1 Tax=Bacillus sp. AFS029533 TaxID=2033494 RepID=UPI000BFC7E4B|nr:hypothetical protein [Bacillus sp. AFS029533]PGZ90951.1 hypothetical protein COE53_16580 [Bacillus sp. AFS029533]
MSFISGKIYKNQIVGTINTYIRMINESDKINESGIGIIDNEWYSYLEDGGKTFVAVLIINGKEEKFYFKEKEWKSLDLNMFENKQLQNLQKRIRSMMK